MMPAPVGISFELSYEVASIEPGKTRRASAIAASVDPVAGEAGIARPGCRSAERDEFAALREAVERRRVGLAAARQGRESTHQHESLKAHTVKRTALPKAGFHCLPLALAVMACKPPPDERQTLPMADAARGKLAIERVGCGSCHSIPGLAWPQGRVGPNLAGFAERSLIAGELPNRPDVLVQYIRNAPALVPGSGMPAMPVDEADARDIAAYLYQHGAS